MKMSNTGKIIQTHANNEYNDIISKQQYNEMRYNKHSYHNTVRNNILNGINKW